MQTQVHTGPANYEPNSFTGKDRGPRPSLEQGFQSLAAREEGEKRRIRAESFADHYSQARLFWISQTPVEQLHIELAFAFELGKCVIPDVRTRVLANLRNVDEDLARNVANKLGMELPPKSDPAVPVRTDLEKSPALSLMARKPDSFAGRKLGLFVSEGADAELVNAIRQAATKAGVAVDVVAPKAGGTTLSDGSALDVDDFIAGAPSVLFDAVALLPGNEASTVAKNPAVKDFVNDAFNHYKFVAYAASAQPLFDATGVAPDEGFVELKDAGSVERFLTACADLRYWDREVFTD